MDVAGRGSSVRSRDVAAVNDMPPRGHYLAHEVGFLAGVSGDCVGQWARRGYIRSSVFEEIPRVYAFQDVVEAIVVHQLFDEGVTHAAVRRLLKDLGEKYGRWPLTHADLWVEDQPGRKQHVFFLEDGETWDRHSQGVLRQIVRLREVIGTLRRGGWVVRNHPEIKHIEVNPDRLSGAPVIRGKRVEAVVAGELALTKEGRQVLRTDYGLTAPEVRDAGKWYRAVLAAA